MKLVLDTHVLIWWYLDHPHLSPQYKKALNLAEENQSYVGISSISLLEIAWLADRCRIKLNTSLDAFLNDLENDPWLHVVPVSATIVLDAIRLGGGFPKDPADRLITATARVEQSYLLTADDRIIRSRVVQVL